MPTARSILVSGSQQDVYLFSQRLIWNRLNAGDACLYATFSRTREDICADLAARGWDVTSFLESGVLKIVDYLSLADRKPRTPEERVSILFSIGKEALNPERFDQIFARESLAVRQRAPDRRLFIVFDSVDRLIEVLGLENTILLSKAEVNGLKGTNSIAVGLLCNEFLSRETLEVLEKMASVFIELKQEWKKQNIHRLVRVTKPKRKRAATDWMSWYG